MTPRLFVALLAAFALAACVSTHPSLPERFAGHWTVGATFSEFVTLDGRAFYIFGDDMPSSAGKFLDAQPSHPDSSSDAGASTSAYVEVIGRLLPYKDPTPGSTRVYQRLHVERVLHMEQARAEYLASFRH